MLKIPISKPFQNYFKQMNIASTENPTRKYKFVSLSYWSILGNKVISYAV